VDQRHQRKLTLAESRTVVPLIKRNELPRINDVNR
jgi:hypothetical protein